VFDLSLFYQEAADQERIAGRIERPQDHKSAKALMSFLLDKVYLGPIHHQLFNTNSNRPLA